MGHFPSPCLPEGEFCQLHLSPDDMKWPWVGTCNMRARHFSPILFQQGYQQCSERGKHPISSSALQWFPPILRELGTNTQKTLWIDHQFPVFVPYLNIFSIFSHSFPTRIAMKIGGKSVNPSVSTWRAGCPTAAPALSPHEVGPTAPNSSDPRVGTWRWHHLKLVQKWSSKTVEKLSK